MTIKLDDGFFQQLVLDASKSPRKRSHYNLHKEMNEPVQRLCIALKKGTYVRPHHHPKSNKWELMLALRGSVVLLVFDNDGVILERLILNQNDSLSGIELKPDTWHTVFPLTDDAIILEVKEGPYIATEKSDFALWAPEEGDHDVTDFLLWLENARPGEKYINHK